MNLIRPSKSKTSAGPTLTNVCLASCQNFFGQIQKTKAAILGEFRAKLEAHEQLLRLALNEAEALAWQTEFPQLFFPTLAMEKVQSVAAWHRRQATRPSN